MTVVDLKLTLPEGLAQQAQECGLLCPQSVTAMLAAEVRRRRIDRLFDAADRLASQPSIGMSDEELNTEILAVRTHRQAQPCES